jgi:acetyl-CoA C-acetyltransferase
MVREADGRGFIETYTVIYDRENQPVRGIIIGRLDDGRRFIAHTPEDRPLLEGLMESEAVGRAGKVTNKDGLNLFDLE